MEVKLLEIRDRATFLPVFAMSTKGKNLEQIYLLSRVGFGSGGAVIIARLNGESPSSADAYFWNDRTMSTAHDYIEEHFDELKDGDVIDVEFILGETTIKKTSERLETYE